MDPKLHNVKRNVTHHYKQIETTNYKEGYKVLVYNPCKGFFS